MSNDFFGGLFDFNRDGKTDFSEQFLGFMIMQDMIYMHVQENRMILLKAF